MRLGVGLGVTVPRGRPPTVAVADLRLRWKPPTLVNPLVVNVPATSAGGHFQQNLSAGQDALVILPATKRVGNVTISGGRHVKVVGGEVEINASPTPGQQQRCLYYLNQTGHVFTEGVHTHQNAAGDSHDACFITNNTSTAMFTFQNCRFDGIGGSFEGFHADGWQWLVSSTWTGVIRINRCSVTSNYQGLYLVTNSIPSAILDQVDFTVEDGPGGAMVWMGDNTADSPYAYKYVDLDDVYITPRPGQSIDTEVRPNSESLVVNQRPVLNNGVLTWPNSPYITGSIATGPPPGGDFCPVGVPGLGYVSPGYVEA